MDSTNGVHRTAAQLLAGELYRASVESVRTCIMHHSYAIVTLKCYSTKLSQFLKSTAIHESLVL